MTGSQTKPATTAFERGFELFTDAVAGEAADRGLNEAGYLNLLDRAPKSTGPTQDLMVTRLMPAIYERYWRPALGRLFKGVTGPGMAEEIRIARLLLGLSEKDFVLDVACGPGNFSREFARAVGPEGLVVGVDASPTMLERGGEELRRADPGNLLLVRADSTDLPFADQSFDGSCCFAALHLFGDPFAALGEMRRVLRPGGRIALMTSIRRELTVKPLKPVLERASGMRIFESDEIVAALEALGFVEIHQRVAGMVQFIGGRVSV